MANPVTPIKNDQPTSEAARERATEGDEAAEVEEGLQVKPGSWAESLLGQAGPIGLAVVNLGGLALGLASAGIQLMVFTSFLGNSWKTTLIVVALEAIKGGTALVSAWGGLGKFLQKTIWGMRTGLMGLSFLASLILVASQISQPNLEAVIEDEIAEVEQRYDERIEAVHDQHDPDIAEYESLMNAEQEDTYPDGTFAGPQFDEFKRLKNELIAQRDSEIRELESQRDARVKEIRQNPPSDHRVQNKMVARFIRLMNALGIGLTNAIVTVAAAGLIAALMEAGIFVSFALIGAASQMVRKQKQQRQREAQQQATPVPSGDGAPPSDWRTSSGDGQSRNEAAQESTGGAQENPSEDENESRSSARRSGRNSKLYSWTVGIFAFALLLGGLGYLEGLTTVAPVQRAAGNVVNLLPSVLMDSAAAERYEHPGRLNEGRRRVVGADGTVLSQATLAPDFPETLQRYLTGVENHRFRTTYAVDGVGFSKALLSLWNGGRIGGSGIIQQFAGNEILRNGEAMKQEGWGWWDAKAREYFVSFGLQARYSHDELLRFYMQTADLGYGPSGAIRGFAEASWAYYDRPLKETTQGQQLALVGLLKSPATYTGVADSAVFRKRYAAALSALEHNDVADAEEIARLRRERPPFLVAHETAREQEERRATYHALRYLRPRVADTTQTIYSTISLAKSVAARDALLRAVADLKRRTGVSDLDGFVIVAEDGKLRAMIGSVSLNGHNRAIEQFAPWTPGSTMKPYTYTEFFAQGGAPADRLAVRSPKTFALPGGGTWRVENYSHRFDAHPPMRADRALAKSINVAAASLAAGPEGKQLRERLAGTGYENFARNPSDVLGSRGVQPLSHFRLLQAFTPPYGAVPQRFALTEGEAVQQQHIWPGAAAETTVRAMGRAVTEGTLSGGRRYGWTARTHHGKTGTGQNHKAATLYVVERGGVSVLMGVYSRSGREMMYRSRAGGVAGGTLIPYVDDLL